MKAADFIEAEWLDGWVDRPGSCRGWGACGVVVGQGPRRRMVLLELDCRRLSVDWLWCFVWCRARCLRRWQARAALEAVELRLAAAGLAGQKRIR